MESYVAFSLILFSGLGAYVVFVVAYLVWTRFLRPRWAGEWRSKSRG